MKSLTSTRGARLACALTPTLFAVAIWCSSPALAASNFDNKFGANKKLSLNSGTPTHAASGSLSGTIVRTLVALLVVVAVIYGLTWILKQSRTTKTRPSVGDGLVQIASMPLGPNRSVSLIRVGAELHLLGVAESGVTGIRVFTEEEAYELGIPFDPDEFETSGRGGGAGPTQRVVDVLRRLTAR
jgi:flagellar protein FliO/FliZ